MRTLFAWAMMAVLCWADTACQIKATNEKGKERVGTCCLVSVRDADRHAFWLTGFHCVANTKGVAIQGRSAKLLGSDPLNDLAVMETEAADSGSKPFILGDDPVVGATVQLIGFGPFGTARHYEGTVTESVGIFPDDPYESFFVINTPPLFGDSGGPVLSRGKLVGMIDAINSNNNCIAVKVGAVRDLMHKLGFGVKPRCESGRCQR